MICPHCNHEIPDEFLARHLAAKGGRAGGAKGGRVRSKAKAAASRRNGRLGGRPRMIRPES